MTHFYRDKHDKILILACGNPLRGDDGAGLVVAREIDAFLQAEGYSTRLCCVQQLAPEMALDIAEASVAAVLFVDTRAAWEAAPSPLTIEIEPIDTEQVPSSFTHHVGPHVLLIYARDLYHRTPPAWLLTIPGTEFDHGVSFSPKVQALLANLSGLANKL